MKNKLKLLRENHSFTQDQLATLVDVSRQTIISLEREKYDPSIQLAFKLSRIFSCTIEDIFIFEEGN